MKLILFIGIDLNSSCVPENKVANALPLWVIKNKKRVKKIIKKEYKSKGRRTGTIGGVDRRGRGR